MHNIRNLDLISSLLSKYAKYKYSVSLRLDLLDSKAKKEARADLCRLLKISPSHFNRLRAIKKGSPASFSGDQLEIMADYFGCLIDSLFINRMTVSDGQQEQAKQEDKNEQTPKSGRALA